MSKDLPKTAFHGGMRGVMKILMLSVLLAGTCAYGQIYADFTVSKGGTPLGTFRANLEYQKAPRTCANFIGLATGQRPWIKVTSGQLMVNKPYYNGLTFHRLIHNFVIQGGSPNGLGNDGPGYVIQDEFDGTLRHSGRYFLSMAKSSLPCTGGSQFFITLAAAPSLDDKHSIFGEVIDGKAIIDNFTNATLFPTDRSAAGASPSNPAYVDKPVTPITMDSVVISGPDLATFDLNNPALMLPVIDSTPLRLPSRDSVANSFAVTFDRGFQTEHFISYSTDLASWTYFRQIRSRDTFAGFTYTIGGVNFPSFFVNSARVNYSTLPNPPADFLSSGKQLLLQDRSGNTVTLVSTGEFTGNWTHSDGSNGTYAGPAVVDGTGPVVTDGTGTTGSVTGTSTSANLFPLAQVNAVFNMPVGPQGWTAIALNLSFHAEKSGWVEGNAATSAGVVAVQQSFTVTP
jgi:peptidyl-prolyl cis-trans isomerase A (cyclophilin A)